VLAVERRMQLRIAAIRRLILVAPQVTDTYNIKIAIYCPQGSGTLRQQLLMMH